MNNTFDIVLCIVFVLIGTGVGLIIALGKFTPSSKIWYKISMIVLYCALGAFIASVGVVLGNSWSDKLIREQQNSTCQECYQSVDCDAKFCSSCGAARETCQSCGVHIKIQDQYCGNCGIKTESCKRIIRKLLRSCEEIVYE